MVDRFFSEMLGVTYDTVVQNIKQHLGSNITPIPRMERILYKARPLWCHVRSWDLLSCLSCFGSR